MTTTPDDNSPLPTSLPVAPPGSAHSKSIQAKWPTVLGAVVLLGVVSWITIPRLPPGICFDDFGDIQLASATLRMAHPPGYAGYVTIGHILARLFGGDPAYVVTLACFGTGLAVLTACLLWQLRFHVSVWLALAICLGFAAHPRFWMNIRAPEVYMPSLALMAWAALFIIRYYEAGRTRNLLIAVALLGFAVANRPPDLFVVPFFLLAWRLGSRKWHGRVRFEQLAWVLPLALIPVAYSAVYVFWRDQPDACYNYIDLYNEENPVLPKPDDGLGARARRVHWMLSAEQFDEYKGVTREKFLLKLRWLQTQFVYERPITGLLAFGLLALNIHPPQWEWYAHLDTYLFCALTAIGLVVSFRRCPVSGWILLGLVVPFLAFALVYHVFGQAADLMPVLFAQTITLGVLGARFIPAGAHWVRHVVAMALAMGGIFLFRAQATSENYEIAAHEFLAEADLATIPGPAIICGNWRRTVPLRYAACVLTPRSDIQIVTSGPALCVEYAHNDERPVYIPKTIETDERCTMTPFRNLYKLECRDKVDLHSEHQTNQGDRDRERSGQNAASIP